MIQAIDVESASRICSGQVVVDLATAVKELIENAVDAGATCISVHLKERGIEQIEVTDNGSGIVVEDYALIARKHYTSKLKIFSDLDNVSSFGFRGEALNSLCELSGRLVVTTKRAEKSIGHQLNFDRQGNLTSQRLTARSTGTTVCIERLFEALPVRRGEFIRSIKKHYQKLLRCLESYAIISVGVKLCVFNTQKGAKQLMLSTENSLTMEENINCVFGNKFFSTLVPIDVLMPIQSSVEGEEVSEAGSLSADPAEGCSPTQVAETGKQTSFLLAGFMSKVGEGVGRSDNDRQFVFCNGRPVDMPKIVKVFNECWRRYEMSNKAAFIVNIVAPPGSLDVNLTPDKREVLLEHEGALIRALKEYLEELFAPSRYTFKVSQGLNMNAYAVSSQDHSDFMEITDAKEAARSNMESAEETKSGHPEPDALPRSSSQETKGPVLLPAFDLKEMLAHFSSSFSTRKQQQSSPHDSIHTSPAKRRRPSPLSPCSEESPTKRLSRILSKHDFQKMRVIGQFNLGFMIAELHGDLFLLDQHACDEKYRFETLQLTTIIHRQKLLCPIYLHASPNYELIISENIDIFEAAGFGIDVIPDGDPGSRVRLTALPYSKSTQFDHNDVLELASLLSDADDTGLASTLLLKNSENTSQSRVKSPKLMAMFASRACRSAVMIGTALNATQMKNIINNLATIDQPWNCPHGRPTMRHLEDLNSVRLRREMLLDESC